MKRVSLIFSLLLLLENVKSDCCWTLNINFVMIDGFNCSTVPGGSQIRKCGGSRLCQASLCSDGLPVTSGRYCGNGPCNLFGCNCEGGCIIGGDPLAIFKENYPQYVSKAWYE